MNAPVWVGVDQVQALLKEVGLMSSAPSSLQLYETEMLYNNGGAQVALMNSNVEECDVCGVGSVRGDGASSCSNASKQCAAPALEQPESAVSPETINAVTFVVSLSCSGSTVD